MRKQRKISQMTEKNSRKRSKQNGDKSDAEFKTLVIRMLQGLIGYFNSIKKTKA